ncbi:MAG: HAD-IIA family hydrolase [Pseudomonadota bacterium]
MINMIKGIVFDLDGTLYRGESIVEKAADTIAVLERNYQIFYLTNNSGKMQQQIVDKLNGFGFRANMQNIYCGSYAISSYLAEKKIISIYLIGTDGLRSELESRNIRVESSSHVSAVVVGLDPSFSYDKISTALEAINNGAKLIVANIDPSYPVENNRKLPGCGAMVGAIVGATGHAPDFHVGKPNTYMLELLCKEHKLLPEEICVVGDDPKSDIKMAVNFQCQSILFDPENVFKAFSGNKISKLYEIVDIINR